MPLKSILVFLGLLLTAGASDADDGFFPAVSAGSSWTIRVFYRDSIEGPSFSPEPLLWRYTTVEKKISESAKVYTVTVKCLDDTITDLAAFRFDANHAFLSGEISTTASGRRVTFSLDNRGIFGPYSSAYGLIPQDFPLFPLVSGDVREYVTLNKISETLKSKQIIKQSITAKGGDVEVVCLRDGLKVFSQVWRQGMPFAVSGENTNMRYELVIGESHEIGK
jgi:hypothetical protein